MTRISRLLSPAFVLAAVLLPSVLFAAEESAPAPLASVPTPAAAPVEATKPIGLTIDVGLASIYAFRGVNVLADRQRDQHFVFSPSLTYAISDSGFSLGYWGAYQINGSNQAAKLRAGAGHEQDLILGYGHDWLDKTLVLSAALTGYLYPFATKKDGLTKCPSYLEPSVKLSYSTALDLSLQLAYFAALQKELKDYRYLYIRPYVSKSVKLNKYVSQLVGVGYGVKIFNDFDKVKNNVHDIAFDVETTVAVTDAFYLKPAIRGAWSNFKKVALGDEFLIYGSFNLGYSF